MDQRSFGRFGLMIPESEQDADKPESFATRIRDVGVIEQLMLVEL